MESGRFSKKAKKGRIYLHGPGLCQSADPGNGGNEKAESHTACSRKKKGESGPFPASGFLFNGKAGSAAGKVHQGKDHDAQSGDPGPAMIRQ